MKASFAAVVFLLCAIFGTPVASAQQSPFWCIFTVNAGTAQAVHYVNDNLSQADDVSYRDVEAAWMSYIRSTYSISLQERANSSTGCNKVSTDAPGGPGRFISQTEQTWKARGHNVVHVNWSYTPSATTAPVAQQQPCNQHRATPTSATAAPTASTTSQHRMPAPQPVPTAGTPTQVAPPQSHALDESPAPVTNTASAAASHATASAGKAYRCIFDFRAQNHAMRYSGGPFVTEAPGPVLSAAWKKFIDDTYHPSDPHRRGGCVMLGSSSHLDRAVSSFEAQSNQLGVGTTHVDWPSLPNAEVGRVAHSSSKESENSPPVEDLEIVRPVHDADAIHVRETDDRDGIGKFRMIVARALNQKVLPLQPFNRRTTVHDDAGQGRMCRLGDPIPYKSGKGQKRCFARPRHQHCSGFVSNPHRKFLTSIKFDSENSFWI
jgi:hypothetical protein